MGVDCYGLSPRNPKSLEKPTIDWDKDPSEEDRQHFWEAMDKYEKEVPGHYFRNNWWYWRPMWGYACGLGIEHGVITQEVEEWGNENSGKEVNGKTAKKWGELILWDIAEGNPREYEEEYMREYKLAQEHNNNIDKALEILRELVRAETGDPDIVPNDYPEEHAKSWQELWNKRNHQGSYPFSEENLKEFAQFMIESGGFQIC
jgi:hypothetical protein|tara:strand:+ start:773 stop:1381 length:609 start_codon:yes stop_codon:yes gene_type:complete